MKNFNFDNFIKPYEGHLKKSGFHRLKYYEYIIKKLVRLNKPISVVETGTMWNSLGDDQGAFTMIFADLIKNYTGGKIITIDISEQHMNLCKENTKNFSDVIEYVVSDSVEYLSNLSKGFVKKIDLLYLDSFDLDMTDPLPSQIHHLRELSSIYHNLSKNVSIAVDDNLMPNCWIEWFVQNKHLGQEKMIINSYDKILGKGTLVDRFLLDNGWYRLPTIESYTILGFEKID